MDFIYKLLKNKIWQAVLAIVIIIAAYAGYKILTKKNITPQYVTEAAAITTISSTVTGTGQVAALNQIDIKPQTDGRLITLNIQQNQQVKTGDVLAIIDQQTAANSVAQARASLEQTQASYDKLMAGATQNETATQQLTLKSAQQALEQAKDDYNNTVAEQQLAVDEALTTLYNTGLTTEQSDMVTTATLTLSGSYNGKTEGKYIISLYNTGNGLYYSSTGLGSESGPVNRGTIQPLGNGLYVTFSTTGTLYSSTVWTVNIPNTKSSSYQTNLIAYNTALSDQKTALKKAQNSIDSAQNSLDKTKIQTNELLAPPATTDIASSKAQVASAQAQLMNAQTAYNNTILKAPFDGVVAAVNFSIGDKVTAGTAVTTIITKQQVVKISLNEVDVAKIKLGDKSIMTFDAIDGLEMTGKVVQIDTIGTVSQGVVTYNVKIALDTQDDRIKPGMSTSASIITSVKTDVLAVPNSAVKSNNNGNYAQILDTKNQPQNISITTGIANDTLTEIISGIKEGDKVITQTINPNATNVTTQSSSNANLRIPGIGGGVGGGR
ncbi:MAG: efflux RND transporter periplasmic adaptor subunit [Candidatus Doudnabacteria bacterium]|nr:efflux RND transporter periplasmic adaptor subunit [Candidatus Doudnabacteria bacterium]